MKVKNEILKYLHLLFNQQIERRNINLIILKFAHKQIKLSYATLGLCYLCEFVFYLLSLRHVFVLFFGRKGSKPVAFRFLIIDLEAYIGETGFRVAILLYSWCQ